MANDFYLLIRHMQQAQAAFIPEMLKAESKTLQAAEDKAHKLSSGTVTSEELSRSVKSGGRGAPYGHGARGHAGPRGPVPYGDPAMINKQSGSFYAAWRKMAATWSANVIAASLVNFDYAANFLSKRTSLAIRRPIDDRIVEQTKRIRLRNLDTAVRHIFGKFK